MPESSVDAYINAQPEQAMSFGDYYYENNGMWGTHDPDNFAVKFLDTLSGRRGRLENEYKTYLENLNKKNEWLASQSARAWDESMANSQMQRAMRDYQAAGLNPYLLLNNGSLASGSVPTSAKADYKHSYSKDEKKSNSGRDLALLLIGVARLAAALL